MREETAIALQISIVERVVLAVRDGSLVVLPRLIEIEQRDSEELMMSISQNERRAGAIGNLEVGNTARRQPATDVF